MDERRSYSSFAGSAALHGALLALLLLGFAGTVLLVRKWRLRTATMPAVAHDPTANDLRERIRRETEV